MGIDDKIRQLWADMDRVRACHPSRLPSWVTAAAIAAGLSLTGAACSKETRSDNPVQRPAGMDPAASEPGPAVALYAGPPPDAMPVPPEPDPVPAGDLPAEGNLYGGPPMTVTEGMVVPQVPAYAGPPMNERPVMNPPPIPPYGVVVPPSPMEVPPMKTPMRRLDEPVTDYGAPFL